MSAEPSLAKYAKEIGALSPDQRAQAWRAAAASLAASGQGALASEAHMQALAASVHDPLMAKAALALAKSDLPVAEPLLREQLKRHPTDIGAMRMLAELGVRVGRYGDAGALLDRALELAPQFEPARFARAVLLGRRNRLEEALEETDALLAKAPNNPAYQTLRASVLVRMGDYETARALYERLLQRNQTDPKLWLSFGHVLKTLGEAEESAEAYRRALALRPAFGESWWSLANLKTFRFSDADVAAMRAALDDASADDEDKLHLHFALGKAFEDAKSYADSFEHYAKANAIRRGQIQYDAAETHAKVTSAKSALTPAFFAARTGFGCEAADPIFVLGLPRAGSTLLEQILASHPEIEGTMELPDIDMLAQRIAAKHDGDHVAALAALSAADCKALGEEYIERTRIQRREGRRFFIDKMPNNWLHVGFIHLILPNAKIIDARRHPMACCFSAWKQHFARGQNFSFELSETGRYYADYAALMAHMDAVLPGRVHRLIHEDLVEQPEPQIRALLDYIGVSFDQGCLEFYKTERAVRTPSAEQVRRPLSRDGLEQWKNYEPWLAPLKAGLGDVLLSWK
ncbi:MAG: sulfotransferase [Hyphomonadaceae bacterium]|nr:sulfotransferase [Hyphomonadaceae bacterium]